MKTQSRIIIKNQTTGEEKIFLGQGSYSAPWKLDRVETVHVSNEKGEPETPEALQRKAKLAVWLQKTGLPLAEFFDAARWLLKKDCPFCQMATQIMKSLDELGDARAEKLIGEILDAKAKGDHAKLKHIKENIWSSEQPE